MAATTRSTAAPERDDVTAVTDTFVALVRSFSRARSKLLAAAAHDVEWSAYVVLKALEHSGPIRSSALAERIESDPSTVSRQVATLVKDGLIERRADPEDGRASLLVLTAKADAVLVEHNDIRRRHFGAMLAGWSDRDLHTFAGLLQRFTIDFEKATSGWLDDTSAGPARSAEGSD